ncbi:MAG TPA: efflux RND transporter permease subunit [Saprospiraceae bacterium]|nr:efflux RND transporter permease subunit [Saprospiraceae bacterium]
MLNFLIKRPIAVLMSFLGLIILGIVVLQILPISLLPEVPIPQISVQIDAPNSSTRELENTVTRTLRNQLLQVGNLKDIRSVTRSGSATIYMDFDFGTNTDLSFIEVNEKIDQITTYLPKSLKRPRVIKANATDIPVFYLSIFPRQADQQTQLQLSEFTRAVLKRRIEQLPQVAFVDRSGFAEAEISIIPRQAIFQSLHLQERDLELALQANNINLGNILVKDGQYQYNIRFLSELKTKEDIENIYLNIGGRIFQLKEIATVQLRAQERRGKYLYDGKPAIVFSVRKQADAQLFALKKSFDELLMALRKDYPQLEFRISNDQSQLLEVSINNLQTSLYYGAFFAFIIMFLFFWEWKAPLLIGLAIPIALVISIFGFYLLGISINVISLSGLVLGVGLMIDNSIIVIENIRQYSAKGLATTEACVQGANEVIRPLISSALTTCSVFLPLVFLSGIAGGLFYDQAVSITVALGASLVVAYILLPTLLRQLGTKTKKQEDNTFKQNIHTKSVDIVLRYKWIFLLLFVLFTASVYFPIQKIKQESFPKLSRNALFLKIDWNEGINVEENSQRVEKLLDKFSDQLNSSNAFIGEEQFLLLNEEQSINETKLYLFVKSSKSTKQLQKNITKYFQKEFPEANVTLAPLKNIFDEIFGANKAPLVAHLQSAKNIETPSIQALTPFFQKLQEANIAFQLPAQEEQFYIKILKEKALRYKVDYQAIYNKLQTLFNQNNLGVLKSTNQYIPITLGTQTASIYQLLQNAQVYNQKNKLVPLKNLIELNSLKDYKYLTAGKTGESLDLSFERYSKNLTNKIQQFVHEDGNYIVNFSGQFFENQILIKELMLVLAIAILLLYLILAAQFESLIQPLIVIMTVPLGLAGAIFCLYWMGQTINLVSIIGMIVMSGIVVNDAILKVDMMNRLSKKHDLITAIHGAGNRRIRAILMTSITTILALVPILFSKGLGAELQQPLAYAVIGGLIVGTIASLYFIPMIYYLIKRNGNEKILEHVR